MSQEDNYWKNGIPQNPKEKNMKVIRILVYEGEEEWVRVSLNEQRYVREKFSAPNGKGSITEYYTQSPLSLLLLKDCPIEFTTEENP